jgi:hypothetical protein
MNVAGMLLYFEEIHVSSSNFKGNQEVNRLQSTVNMHSQATNMQVTVTVNSTKQSPKAKRRMAMAFIQSPKAKRRMAIIQSEPEILLLLSRLSLSEEERPTWKKSTKAETKTKKGVTVSFGSVSIRFYERVAVESPTCTVAIGLGGRHTSDCDEFTLSLDQYEEQRGPTRLRSELILSARDRRNRNLLISLGSKQNTLRELRRQAGRCGTRRTNLLKVAAFAFDFQISTLLPPEQLDLLPQQKVQST